MWILLDMGFMSHRALHSTGNLETEDIPTGVLYGFFEQLYDICSNPRFTSNRIGVCLDSRKSYRCKLFPEYKKKRREEKTEEEKERLLAMYEQVRILKNEWLPAMGIPTYRQVGLESDDLLAQGAIVLTKNEERGVIITSDGDLYQCITPYVTWYDPQRDKFFNEESFLKKKGVSAKQWREVKAIGGCGTDGVPGIKGVSETGAISYLRDEIPHHHKRYQNIKTAVEEGKDKFWDKLTGLPHKKTKPVELKVPKYKPEVFFEYCEKYGIDSYLDEHGRKRWSDFFKGRFTDTPVRRRNAEKRKRKLI